MDSERSVGEGTGTSRGKAADGESMLARSFGSQAPRSVCGSEARMSRQTGATRLGEVVRPCSLTAELEVVSGLLPASGGNGAYTATASSPELDNSAAQGLLDMLDREERCA